MPAIDLTLLHELNGFAARHDAIEDPLALYVGASEALFVGLLAILALADRVGGRLRRAAVAAGFSAAIALACAQVLSRLVDRPRPFVADPGGVQLFAAHAADASFPSDHATAAFAIAVALVLRDRRWGAAALGLAALLAVGRVALGVHYPSDVLAGAALGGGVALAFHVTALRAGSDRLADLAGGVIDALRRRLPQPLRGT